MLRRAEVTRSTQLPRELVFAALADHGRYPDWLPGLMATRILEREGDVVTLEIRAPRFDAAAIVLELVRSPPAEIRFLQIGGGSGIEGRCLLHETETGTRVRVELQVEAPLLRLGAGRRLRGAVEDALAALARRAAEMSAGGATAEPRRKILEIRELGDALEIDLRGERYRLVRVDAGKAG